MNEAAERWSACSIATAAWPRTWRQPADRGVTWRSQGRWRRARPHRRNSETGSKPHEVGVQIPRRVHSEVPPEDPLWRAETAFGGGFPQAGCAEGEPDRGRPPPARSRPYDDFDPAEICGVTGGRLYQRQERDPSGS